MVLSTFGSHSLILHHNMEHIKQITNDDTYIVVIENGEQAITEHPELFERVNGKIPDNAQFLIYTS
jgi:hypothetical protein